MPDSKRSGGWPGSAKHRRIVRRPYLRYLKWKARSVDRFIFVATTGRSGSGSLAQVFSCVPDCVARHEPGPVMTSAELSLERERFGAVDRLFDLKAIQILRDALEGRVYLETNHQFIKRFASMAVASFGPKLRVLHLVRDPIDVALSFQRIGSIPGLTAKGRKYLLDPEAGGNCIDLGEFSAGFGGQRSEVLRCLWYWYETEARVLRFRREYPEVQVQRLRTEDLNNYDRMVQMLQDVEVPFVEGELRALVGTRANRKRHKGEGAMSHREAAAVEADLRSFVEERYGYDFAIS